MIPSESDHICGVIGGGALITQRGDLRGRPPSATGLGALEEHMINHADGYAILVVPTR
jgi:hypothetical protein